MAVVKRNVFPVQPTAIKGNEINDRVRFGVKSQPCGVRSHGLLSASHRTTEKPPTTAANFTSCRSLARSPPALFLEARGRENGYCGADALSPARVGLNRSASHCWRMNNGDVAAAVSSDEKWQNLSACF